MNVYSVKDIVMVYGHKATVQWIEYLSNTNNKNETNKIYAVKYLNKNGYMDGIYRGKKMFTPENGLIVICSHESIKPYNSNFPKPGYIYIYFTNNYYKLCLSFVVLSYSVLYC